MLEGEKRKVQLQGGKKKNHKTYTISLPKDWAENNNIKQGTELEIFKNNALLILTDDIPPDKRKKLIDVLNT